MSLNPLAADKLTRSENAAFGVITSYSIHYTKLYDPPTGKITLFLGKGGSNSEGVMFFVITSYSIHYTKLYDSQQKIKSLDEEEWKSEIDNYNDLNLNMSFINDDRRLSIPSKEA